MVLLSFILNLPWTLLGLLLGLFSPPYRLKVTMWLFAIVVSVKSFWWLSRLPGKKGVRATTLGHVVLLGKTLDKDLEHELIHVEQYQRAPFVHPFLYIYQSLKYGYRKNRYEVEAYDRAGNRYIEG